MRLYRWGIMDNRFHAIVTAPPILAVAAELRNP
jgi:hypothetical protein